MFGNLVTTRIIRLMAGAAILLAGVSIVSPTTTALAVSVSVGCSGSNLTLPTSTGIHSSGPLLFSEGDIITVTAGAPFNVTINGGGSFAGGTAWSYKIPNTGYYSITATTSPATATTFTTHCANVGPVPAAFVDGRCNQEADQSVAIYPDGYGGYDFYAVNTGVGFFAFNLSTNQLAANPAGTAAFLITQNLTVPVYRLTDGSLQTQRAKPDGKTYVFTWMNCGWAVY